MGWMAEVRSVKRSIDWAVAGTGYPSDSIVNLDSCHGRKSLLEIEYFSWLSVVQYLEM